MPSHDAVVAPTLSLDKPGSTASGTLVPFGLFFAVLLFVTVGQRFAVPGTGGRLGVGFVLAFGAFVFGMLNGVLRISPVRALFYLVMASTLIALIFTLHTTFSQLSLAMLLILYIPFVAVAPMQGLDYERILLLYQDVMSFCAVCGLLQFLTQFVLGPKAMFPFDQFLPSSFFQPNFNLMIPIGGGSSLLKSTGLWFLEPSVFSQFVGLSIVIEVMYFRRLPRILLFVIAYIPSFSGTGAVVITVGTLLYTIQRGHFLYIFVAAFLFLIVLTAFQNVPPFSLFFERLGEFSNGQASGAMRFLAPYRFVNDVLAPDLMRLLFGFGSGSMSQAGAMLDYKVQDTGWLKLLCEYGVVGTASFMAFYLYCIFWRTPNVVLSCVCLTQFLLLGGYLNQYYLQFLHLVLVGWPKICAYSKHSSSLNCGVNNLIGDKK